MPISVVLLICACHHSEKEKALFSPVYVAKHTLMTLSPDFTMEADSMALYKQYLRLRTGKEFPMIGVLRVKGKSYRFIGGDSLRIAPIASIYSGEGWSGNIHIYIRERVGKNKNMMIRNGRMELVHLALRIYTIRSILCGERITFMYAGILPLMIKRLWKDEKCMSDIYAMVRSIFTAMESIFRKLIIKLCNWNAGNYPV